MISRITYRSMMRGMPAPIIGQSPAGGWAACPPEAGQNDREAGPPLAHAPALLRGSRHRRAHPAVGPAARHQGLLGHGRDARGVSRRSRHVQPGAVAHPAGPGVCRGPRAGPSPRARAEARRRAHARRGALDGRQRISRAVRPDDRSVSSIRPAARLSHGAAAIRRGRSARSAGLAQARVDGSRSARRATRGWSRSSKKDRGFSEDDKTLLQAGRARRALARGPRVSGGQRARTGRARHLAVLSPDPAAAVRFGRASGRAARRAEAAPAVHAARRCAAADRSRRSPFTKRRSEAGRRDVAFGGIGFRRGGRVDGAPPG